MTPERIEYYYNKYRQRLIGFAVSMVGPTYGEDLVSDAFIELCKADDMGEREVWQYLHKSIQFAGWNLLNRNKILARHHDIILGSSDDYEQAIEIKRDVLAAIVEEINKLPIVMRLIFKMRYIEGKSQREICKTLKIKPGTIDTQIMRAKQRIRSVFKDRDP